MPKCLIKLIGRRNTNTGTLSNLTDGGEGSVGMIYTNEQKEKARDRINILWAKGIFDNRDLTGENNGFYKKHHTEESKEKMRNSIGDRSCEKNANYGNKWSDEQKIKASKRQKENHVHLIGENNPAKRIEVRKKLSDDKLGDKNPNAKKWILLSPDNEEFIINGGIKRNLKRFNLTYSMFGYYKDNEKRKTKNGWILKEF